MRRPGSQRERGEPTTRRAQPTGRWCAILSAPLLGGDSALLASRRRGKEVTDAAFEQLALYAITFRVRVRRGVGELVADEGPGRSGSPRQSSKRTPALALLGGLLIVPGVPRALRPEGGVSERPPTSGIADALLIELAVSGKSYGAIAKTVGLSATVWATACKSRRARPWSRRPRCGPGGGAGILRANSTRLARKLVKISTGEIKGSSEQVPRDHGRPPSGGAGDHPTRRAHWQPPSPLRRRADAQEAKLLAAMGEDGEP